MDFPTESMINKMNGKTEAEYISTGEYDSMDFILTHGPLCRINAIKPDGKMVLGFNRKMNEDDINEIIHNMVQKISKKIDFSTNYEYLISYESYHGAGRTLKLFADHPDYNHFADITYQAIDNMEQMKSTFTYYDKSYDETNLNQRLMKGRYCIQVKPKYDAMLASITEDMVQYSTFGKNDWFMDGAFWTNYLLPFRTFHPIARAHGLREGHNFDKTNYKLLDGFVYSVRSHHPLTNPVDLYRVISPGVGSIYHNGILTWDYGQHPIPKMWKNGVFLRDQLEFNMSFDLQESISEILMRQDPQTGMSYMAWAQDPILGPFFGLFEYCRDGWLDQNCRTLMPMGIDYQLDYDTWERFISVEDDGLSDKFRAHYNYSSDERSDDE
jgi:hypothetical protein